MGDVALVTGASSGIGRATAELLRERGYAVYDLSRSGKTEQGITHITADVTDESSVNAAVAEIIAKEGKIDLLINNAGFGISRPVEFTETADARRIMDVNFLGQFLCAKAVLPHMRERRSGRIVALSSVASPIAIPYQGFYSASKAAASSLALALRNEVKEFGIKVCAVMPGDASTGFTAARKKSANGADVYTRSDAAVAAMEKDERSGMSAADVARVIYKAATAKNPKPLYVAGGKYKLFMALFKLLPARAAYWIVGKMYS